MIITEEVAPILQTLLCTRRYRFKALKDMATSLVFVLPKIVLVMVRVQRLHHSPLPSLETYL
jgi:hypothetical protein